MSKNVLFNLIQEIISPKNPNELNLLEHKSGAKYFLFELPVPKIKPGSYELINHHLSVYEEATTTLGAKSQYHYTGYFKTEDKQYQLHVYFDEEDNIVFKPMLAELIAENEYKPVACAEYEEIFKKFTTDSMHDLVRFLRNEQAEQINICQEKYDEIEKVAHQLYTNLPASKEEYLEVIGQLIRQLDVISSYATPCPKFSSTRKFLQNLMISVNEIEKTVSDETPKTSKQQLDNTRQDAITNISSKNKSNKPKVKPSIDSLLNNLQNQFKKMAALKSSEKIDCIKSYYAELNEMELLLTFGAYTGSTKGIQDMNAFKRSLETAGANLIKEFLITDQTKQAEQLKLFYSQLQAKELAGLALHLNRPLLLEFLLKNELLSIHYKNFDISGGTYTSMLDYCFKTTTEKHHMMDCLNVLIEHGASLHEIDMCTGLPFFANLVLNEEHLLRKSLNHPKIDNSIFYAQARKLLLAFSADGDNQPDIQKVTEYIFDKSKLQCLKSLEADAVMVDGFARQQEEHDIAARKFFGDELYRKLNADPEIMALELNQKIRLTNLINAAPEELKISILELYVKHNIGASVINDFQGNDKLPSFDEVKSSTILLRVKELKGLNHLTETLEISRNLKTNSMATMYFELMNTLSRINNFANEEGGIAFNIPSYNEFSSLKKYSLFQPADGVVNSGPEKKTKYQPGRK